MASKLVQQVNNDDPPLYEVTYMHDHTCKAEHIPPPDIDVMDAAGPPDASDGFVLSFGSSSGGRGGHRDALMIPEVRQPMPPSPFTTMCFGSSSSSDSQIMHENLDSFQINDDALWSPAESWPSTSSDEGDLFSAWDSFSGFGFDNHAPYPEPTRQNNSTPPSVALPLLPVWSCRLCSSTGRRAPTPPPPSTPLLLLRSAPLHLLHQAHVHSSSSWHRLRSSSDRHAPMPPPHSALSLLLRPHRLRSRRFRSSNGLRSSPCLRSSNGLRESPAAPPPPRRCCLTRLLLFQPSLLLQHPVASPGSDRPHNSRDYLLNNLSERREPTCMRSPKTCNARVARLRQRLPRRVVMKIG
ncbi:hypothetical protein PR202_ga20113 [Eleusine coracana subsp. coracana]|uniref:WRKY domain-containing protein n=1 Tax=Eleusine coracana subsp. coracana TaxID=191504 RepID=A0AAV5CW88_ELECO|nr:hypothetical protein PR202_ga20113 [Eleusine coracana subsp. coracana]